MFGPILLGLVWELLGLFGPWALLGPFIWALLAHLGLRSVGPIHLGPVGFIGALGLVGPIFLDPVGPIYLGLAGPIHLGPAGPI